MALRVEWGPRYHYNDSLGAVSGLPQGLLASINRSGPLQASLSSQRPPCVQNLRTHKQAEILKSQSVQGHAGGSTHLPLSFFPPVTSSVNLGKAPR